MSGDTKLRSEGRMDQGGGKIHNTVGGLKDSLRENNRRSP